MVAFPASVLSLWAKVEPYAQRLAVWQGYERELTTLAIYGVGVALYATLVYTFYNNIARRQPFHIPLSDRKGWVGGVSRFVEKAFVFPVTSFLYFAFLALALFVLAKSQSTQGILLIAMAVIVGIRVSVYISQGIAGDLAKLVPLSLLGVLLVDPGYLTLGLAWTRLGEAFTLAPLLGRYFLLFMALEAALGMVRWSALKVAGRFRRRRERKTARAPEPTVSVPVQETPPTPAKEPSTDSPLQAP